MATSVPIRIISICDDEGLRTSRELLLEHEHFEVHSFSSFDHPGISLIREAHLVIVCQSVNSNCVEALRDKFRRYNPEARFLDLRSVAEHSLDGSTMVAFTGEGLIRIVRAISDWCQIETPHGVGYFVM